MSLTVRDLEDVSYAMRAQLGYLMYSSVYATNPFWEILSGAPRRFTYRERLEVNEMANYVFRKALRERRKSRGGPSLGL